MRVRAIIISNAGRILLGLNQDDEYALPGGNIKEGEHPVDALLREVYEETGIKKFERIEYLWPYVGNYVFIYLPEDNMLQPTCANDPSSEFKSLEWFNLEALPFNFNDYSEDIIYHFLRVEILHTGKETMKITEAKASHIDVLVDGKKAFQLDDDTIWLTLPRLAQERSKGKQIEFKQVLDDGSVVDQTPVPMPVKKEENKVVEKVKEKVKNKEATKTTSSCYPYSFLAVKDLTYYNKCILLDISSELLNPSVQILKAADTFDNTLLFDGIDEFWITHCCQPIWRSNYMDRYASYVEVVQKWNEFYPKHILDLDWFKNTLKRIMEEKEGKEEKGKDKKDKSEKVKASEDKPFEGLPLGKRYPKAKRTLSDKDIKDLDTLFHQLNTATRYTKEWDTLCEKINKLLGYECVASKKKA